MLKQVGRLSPFKSTIIHQSTRNVSVGGKTQIPPKLNELNHNLLTIEHTKSPKTKSPYNQLEFGKELTDHMLQIDWTNDYGWKDPHITPYGEFKIDPAATCLHYALEAFEGILFNISLHIIWIEL